jgi:DNA-binding transcriptional MerR regulator
MKPGYLRTSEIANAVGVHPNTVRLYEKWGYLPPIRRGPNGYRRFTEAHLDQMRMARTVRGCAPLGGNASRMVDTLIRRGAANDLGGALELAYQLLSKAQTERAQAEDAAEFLKRWAQGTPADTTGRSLHIGETAKLLNTTIDSLRNWERNGLIKVPRDPANSYRLYGAGEIGRLRVIRMLIRSGYSTMALLRTLLHLDQGRAGGQRQLGDLRKILDTPRPDEEVFFANDRWLSALGEIEQTARKTIALLEEMLRKQAPT